MIWLFETNGTTFVTFAAVSRLLWGGDRSGSARFAPIRTLRGRLWSGSARPAPIRTFRSRLWSGPAQGEPVRTRSQPVPSGSTWCTLVRTKARPATSERTPTSSKRTLFSPQRSEQARIMEKPSSPSPPSRTSHRPNAHTHPLLPVRGSTRVSHLTAKQQLSNSLVQPLPLTMERPTRGGSHAQFHQ